MPHVGSSIFKNTNLMNTEEKLGAMLRERGWTLGTAESCTGGRIASRITSVAGSSDYFVGGIVSYSNAVKHNLLGVLLSDLEHEGAVSQPVVEEMAIGARRVLGCHCTVATSGIAGPGGGTAEKPVGTVWIAAACGDRLVSRCFHFPFDRVGNVEAASEEAMKMLMEMLP